jgi:hypothetical protein
MPRPAVGGQRRGQRTAGDESEVTWSGAGDQTGVGAGHQRIDDRSRVFALLRHRPAQRFTHLGRVDAGGHRALIKGVEERVCVLRGAGETRSAIGHG